MTNVNNHTEKAYNHADGSENNQDTNMLPTPGCFKNVSDRVLKAKAKLLESPYDLESWNILIKDVQVFYLFLVLIGMIIYNFITGKKF